MTYLEFSKGPLAGKHIEVDREIVLGREGDFAIPDNEMSRHHVRMRPVDGGIEVEDLGSTNGTWVNGAQIQTATRVSGGATIEMGESQAQLVLPGSDEALITIEPMAHERGRRRPAATRMVGAQIATYLVIFAVAVALVLYFAMR